MCLGTNSGALDLDVEHPVSSTRRNRTLRDGAQATIWGLGHRHRPAPASPSGRRRCWSFRKATSRVIPDPVGGLRHDVVHDVDSRRGPLEPRPKAKGVAINASGASAAHRGCAWLSPSWCGLVRSDLDRLSMIPAEVLANAGDTGPAGDKPGQRRVVRTRRITVDHGLAVGNLQQPGVVDLSPRCVPDEEAAESKLGRHIAVPSTPDPRRSRHGKRSKTGEPVSIAPCPSRRGHPTDRDDGVTCDGTQPRGHDRQHTPEPSSRLRDARVGCGARGPAPNPADTVIAQPVHARLDQPAHLAG